MVFMDFPLTKHVFMGVPFEQNIALSWHVLFVDAAARQGQNVWPDLPVEAEWKQGGHLWIDEKWNDK